jgi:hypothetical protein
MKTWVRKSLSVGILAAGALLVSQSVAQADGLFAQTGPNIGAINGAQTIVEPTTLTNAQCGAPVVTGLGIFDCSGGASAGGDEASIKDYQHTLGGKKGDGVQQLRHAKGGQQGHKAKGGKQGHKDNGDDNQSWSYQAYQFAISTGPNIGTGNGIQTIAPITTVTNAQCAAPVVTGLGIFDCSGGAGAGGGAGGVTASSGPNIGTGNGLQNIAPVTTLTNAQCAAPVVTGLGIFDCSGGASAGGGATEGAKTKHVATKDYGYSSSDDSDGGIVASSGPNIGTANGVQTIAPVTTLTNAQCVAPVVTGLGIFDCSGGASAGGGATEGAKTKHVVTKDYGGGSDGGSYDGILAYSGPNIGTGNGVQTIAPVTTVTNVQCAAPVVTGLGIFDCSGGATAESGVVASTGPNIGTGNGVQTIAPVTTLTNAQCAAPVTIGLGIFDCSGGAKAESASASHEEALPVIGGVSALKGLPVLGELTNGGAPAATGANPAVSSHHKTHTAVDHKAGTDLKAAPAVTKADDGYGKKPKNHDGKASQSNALSNATGAANGLPVPALV